MNTCRMFFGFLLLLFFNAGLAQAEDSWTLEKDSDGIKVYTRALETSAFKSFKATTNLAATPEAVLAVIRNTENFTRWMANTAHVELIDSSETQQSAYVITKLPFPFKKRDAIFRYTLESSTNKAIKLAIDLDNAKAAANKKYERIVAASGYWLIEAQGEGVLLTYELQLNPGGSLPAWLVNSQVVDGPYQTLRNLKQELQ